jgi:hypothetical protein
MLQINNSLRTRTEAEHSLKEIMELAIGLPAVSRVNSDNNDRVPQGLLRVGK